MNTIANGKEWGDFQAGNFQAGNKREVNKNVTEEMPPFEHIWGRSIGIPGGRQTGAAKESGEKSVQYGSNGLSIKEEGKPWGGKEPLETISKFWC